MKTVSVIILGMGLILVNSCIKQKPVVPQVSNCDNVKFSTTIKPIIEANCVSCHVQGNGPGDFTTYAGILVKVQNGSFRARVIHENTTFQPMPPSGKLPNDQIAKIQCWLDAGAPNN